MLLWKDTNNIFYCSLCRVNYIGNSCPYCGICVKVMPNNNWFNNTEHIIIATKDYCNYRQHGCNKDCDHCVFTNTYPDLKVL